MFVTNLVAFILILLGAFNWGLIGIFKWNLVDAIFGVASVGSTIVYIIVCVAALWLIFSAIISGGRILSKD